MRHDQFARLSFPLLDGPTRHRLLSFRQREDGTLTVFTIMMMMLMIMMGGIAVDVMRYETRRTSLQNTLDRSTLAAASLNQTLDPRAVVDDYFLKAGLSQYLTSVTVTQGVNYREVAANALADTQPLFLHLLGINRFDAPGHSMAEQRVNNVEVMLVLDVSGSMNSNNKIQNLQSAASTFVATVLANDGDHKISIGIVPFNGQINLGATLRGQFNAIYPHGAANVNCLDLPVSVYSNTYIDQTTPIGMTANADTYSGTSTAAIYTAYNATNATPNLLNQWCPARPGNIVRPPQQDVATLQGYINGLSAVGATSINAGMAWGLSLLDPQSRGLYSNMISAGLMPSTTQGRPFDFVDHNAMKVIILMTDGENFAEERVKDPFKSGASIIWRSTPDGYYSAFQTSLIDTTNATTICNSRPYYVPHLSQWHSRPWNGTAPANASCYDPTATVANSLITNSSQLTWPQVWTNMRLSYVAWQFYGRALGGSISAARITAYNNAMTAFKTLTPTTTMDTQLQTMCTEAKAQGVLIYGIAFEAPTNGQAQISNCSTSLAYYFNASGLQITTAFNAIANNISQLRLTQ